MTHNTDGVPLLLCVHVLMQVAVFCGLFLERGEVCHTPTSLPSMSVNVLTSKRADTAVGAGPFRRSLTNNTDSVSVTCQKSEKKVFICFTIPA